MMIRKFELTDAEKFWRLQKALDQETKFMMYEASPDLFCRLVSRTVVGNYVLDEERVTGRAGNGGESHAVAVYRVESGQIQHVRFLR